MHVLSVARGGYIILIGSCEECKYCIPDCHPKVPILPPPLPPPPPHPLPPGFQTALNLARQGAHVILACRDPVRADQATSKIRQKQVSVI